MPHSTPSWFQERCSGVLLHPTSLPGPHGVGDLGPAAFQFVEKLAEWHQTLWQVLPLGPVGFGYSPYQSPSAFAINPMLISPEKLVDAGWLVPETLEALEPLPAEAAQFAEAEARKAQLLREAFVQFQQNRSDSDQQAWTQWCEEQAFWLEDYAAFMVLKELHGEGSWTQWPEGSRKRRITAMRTFRTEQAEALDFQRFVQWVGFEQWHALKEHANQRGIRIIGDLPIFVSHESADVWAHPELFELDASGQPTVIAGVPPDYFSETGQRWGNPLYCWDKLAKTGFLWWRQRLGSLLSQFDLIRIDHFRGFESYWEIPVSEPTAIRGHWKPGPGFSFFKRVQQDLGKLPVIAEDLGLITPEVHALRQQCEFPGMKILQFAFSDPDNLYLPHNIQGTDSVAYTGTHDNDTLLGWFRTLEASQREFLNHYLSRDVHEDNVCYELIRTTWATTAQLALVPLQDLLGLETEARMNTPGTVGGANWRWRYQEGDLERVPADWLRLITRTYSRKPVTPPSPEGPAEE